LERLAKVFRKAQSRINQGSATYGPRTGFCPPSTIIRPTAPLQIVLTQLRPTQMAYWTKNYVSISTRAARWM